ncbi:hypothetical protein AMATHDRAFT_51732 [Amanita thiersii Skay4041]|uniref:Uncharacterized protein n=1 Tax=Amanita thiersii Skay4041 TaxID=703135 RepID=A0A2A9NBZ5_9AGAR|nr:hypothetical protein AMATHDRAFT_51732 [Amanita thiersii Skay4041]
MIARAVFQPQEPATEALVEHVQSAFWACVIGNTIYSTTWTNRLSKLVAMIAYRITSVAKMNKNPTRQFRFVLRVIIESGLVIVATGILAFVISFGTNRFAILFISAAVSINNNSSNKLLKIVTQTFQITGIAFNLILIRVMYNVNNDAVYTARGPLTTIQFTNGASVVTQSSSRSGEGDIEQGKLTTHGLPEVESKYMTRIFNSHHKQLFGTSKVQKML